MCEARVRGYQLSLEVWKPTVIDHKHPTLVLATGENAEVQIQLVDSYDDLEAFAEKLLLAIRRCRKEDELNGTSQSQVT